jgi:hypothetical protein
MSPIGFAVTPPSGDIEDCRPDLTSHAQAAQSGISRATSPAGGYRDACRPVGDCWHATVVRIASLLGDEIVPRSVPLLVRGDSAVRVGRVSLAL